MLPSAIKWAVTAPTHPAFLWQVNQLYHIITSPHHSENDTLFEFSKTSDCYYKIIVPNANNAFWVVLDISAVKEDVFAVSLIRW